MPQSLKHIYQTSLALFTDFYQLTMAYAYWKSGSRSQEAVFHLFFRHNPFKGGFAVFCGLKTAIEFIQQFRFTDTDLAYLKNQQDSAGNLIFEPAFLDYLKHMNFTCDVDAVPDGTVVFAGEPLVRIQGPIIQAQLLESALLNIINFQTLLATKAARIKISSHHKQVIEFGMRRAQCKRLAAILSDACVER